MHKKNWDKYTTRSIFFFPIFFRKLLNVCIFQFRSFQRIFSFFLHLKIDTSDFLMGLFLLQKNIRDKN